MRDIPAQAVSGGVPHQVASVTVTSQSIATSGEIIPFDEDEALGGAGAFAFTRNVPDDGVTYDETTGQFNVPDDGEYTVTVVYVLTDSSTVSLTRLLIRINAGAAVYQTDIHVHASLSPGMFTIEVPLVLSANDNVTASFDGLAAQTVNTEAGLTMTVRRTG